MTDSNPSASNRDLLTSGPTPVNPFTFSTGDTKILVTYQGNKIEGLVSSHSLCQASPVWKRFIYPPWGAQDPGPNAINCSEDNGEALLILMNIIHLRFQQVPDTTSIEMLYQIASLCEQYQCVHVVAPWVGGWVKRVICPGSDPRLLNIYWSFGYITAFETVADQLACELRYSNDMGQWVRFGPQPIQETLLPDLLESILTLRSSKIDQFYMVIDAFLAHNGQNFFCRARTSFQYEEVCKALVRNRLAQKLTEFGIIPRKDNSNFNNMSVYDLMNKVRYLG